MSVANTVPNDLHFHPDASPRGTLAARHLAMPADTNPAGNIFGGWIMASMDAAAAMTMTRLVESDSVTVAVSNMVFMQPIKVGDTVCFYTDVARIGRTSLTLNVEVWVLRRGCGQRIKVTQAEFTFVVVDEDGRPKQFDRANLVDSACLPMSFASA